MENDFAERRKQLVQSMKLHSAIKTLAVEIAFLKVKRDAFFPQEKSHAYIDSAFPIGFGQTISQPTTIAVMLEMLDARHGQKVLEVGAGSGYVLALLSELVGEKGRVFGIEIVNELMQRAQRTLLGQGSKNTELTAGDGTLGWEDKQPFDRILVSAACPSIPDPLVEQLNNRGKIVAPLGSSFSQEIVCLQKQGRKLKEISRQCCFVFVPLKGKHGF